MGRVNREKEHSWAGLLLCGNCWSRCSANPSTVAATSSGTFKDVGKHSTLSIAPAYQKRGKGFCKRIVIFISLHLPETISRQNIQNHSSVCITDAMFLISANKQDHGQPFPIEFSHHNPCETSLLAVGIYTNFIYECSDSSLNKRHEFDRNGLLISC